MASINYENFYNDTPLMVISGPCQIETRDHAIMIAEHVTKACDKLGVPLLFKASFDKANRSSMSGKRGIGMDEGLRILQTIKTELGVSVTTDIHLPDQAQPVDEVVELIKNS